MRDAQSVLVLTGAGVSAESGVPTFRGGGNSAVWKGMPFGTREFDVLAAQGRYGCFAFPPVQKGEKYLVYARWAENNQLVARACTRTRVLSNDVPDFQELDILNPGAYHAPSPTSLSRWLDTTLPRYAYAADFEELTLQQHYRIVSLPARARRGA